MSLTVTLPSTTSEMMKSLALTKKVRGPGRPPIPAHEVSIMRKLRQDGMTIQKIGYFTERCIATVSKYTTNIPNSRRPNTTIKINRRTGLVSV